MSAVVINSHDDKIEPTPNLFLTGNVAVILVNATSLALLVIRQARSNKRSILAGSGQAVNDTVTEAG